jgi:hypothetical protein
MVLQTWIALHDARLGKTAVFHCLKEKRLQTKDNLRRADEYNAVAIN